MPAWEMSKTEGSYEDEGRRSHGRPASPSALSVWQPPVWHRVLGALRIQVGAMLQRGLRKVWERRRGEPAADQLQVVSRLPVHGTQVMVVEFESSRFVVATSVKGQIALLQIDSSKAAVESPSEDSSRGPARAGRVPVSKEESVRQLGRSRGAENGRGIVREAGRATGRVANRTAGRAVSA